MQLSSYRAMWIIAMFDLPVDTKAAKRNDALFRKCLLSYGFSLLQFSVYGRHCASEENADVHLKRIERNIPPDGEVRVLTVTDKQFERMRIFWGKMRGSPPAAPGQLALF